MRIFESPVVLIVLIVLIVVLFGAKRMPDVAKSVGSSLKIFKKEVRELTEDDDKPRESTTDRTAEDASTTAPQPHVRADGESPASGPGDTQNTRNL